jgi:hypothetical protein
MSNIVGDCSRTTLKLSLGFQFPVGRLHGTWVSVERRTSQRAPPSNASYVKGLAIHFNSQQAVAAAVQEDCLRL